MTKNIVHEYGISDLLIGEYCMDGVTTVNATPVLMGSIGIPLNKSYRISVTQMAVRSDGTSRSIGDVTGVFFRGTGDISQEGTLTKNLIGILSGAQVQFTINNTAHTVEIYAKGTTATINWAGFTMEVSNN